MLPECSELRAVHLDHLPSDIEVDAEIRNYNQSLCYSNTVEMQDLLVPFQAVFNVTKHFIRTTKIPGCNNLPMIILYLNTKVYVLSIAKYPFHIRDYPRSHTTNTFK